MPDILLASAKWCSDLSDDEFSELAEALEMDIADVSALASFDDDPFRNAFDRCVNGYLMGLASESFLPTQREAAKNLSNEIEGLKQIKRKFIEAANQIIEAQEAAIKATSNAIMTAPATMIVSSKFCTKIKSRNAARAAIESATDIDELIDGIAAEVDRLEKSTVGKRMRRPRTTLAFLRAVHAHMQRAGLNVSLPPDSAYDTAEDFALFRVARLALQLAGKRVPATESPSELSRALSWSTATLLHHLRTAVPR